MNIMTNTGQKDDKKNLVEVFLIDHSQVYFIILKDYTGKYYYTNFICQSPAKTWSDDRYMITMPLPYLRNS